jgi:NADH:ubiquinone oxidoreductase subunit 4 (subunit M)
MFVAILPVFTLTLVTLYSTLFNTYLHNLPHSNLLLNTQVVPCTHLNYFDVITYWPFIFIFVLITFLTLIYSFTYNINELKLFFLYTLFILLVGSLLFSTNSIIYFFFLYESFLIPSFLILYSFAKTRKAVEAAYLMFFWTQFGALFLIFNFQYLFFITESHLFSVIKYVNFSNFEVTFLFVTLVFGFGVKLPIWPFYDWLPKAHVEASTNFSIFLSGVLVKFAFFGFLKYLVNLGIDITPVWFYPFIFIGFIDAASKMYYQTDLKKLIAYSTVIEMHWLVLAVVSGNSFFWIAGFAMMISHALISSNFFLIVDSITRRFKTRLITEIGGLLYITPSLYFLTLILLLVFLGFPGSLLFIAEFMFFSALLDFNFIVFIITLFMAYFFVPSCFFKSWFLLMFGSNYSDITNNKGIVDLDFTEYLLLSFSIILVFWLGFTFQFFV